MNVPSVYEHKTGDLIVKTIVADATWKENCYLVTSVTSGEQLIVDPGSNADFIIATIEESGSGGLQHILLTHGHFDHVGAAEKITEKFNCSSLVHKADARLLRQAPFYALRYGNKAMAAPVRYIAFEDELEISIGGSSVISLHTPGHTAGSVSYFFHEFLFTGDTLLKNYVGRTDQPGGDEAAIEESIARLLRVADDDAVIFPGHGKPWTVAEARLWWLEASKAPPKHDAFIH
jgi:hydroxyacylglutathione hydrolase